MRDLFSFFVNFRLGKSRCLLGFCRLDEGESYKSQKAFVKNDPKCVRKKCRFVRIDADIDGALKGENNEKIDDTALIEVFKKHLVNKTVYIYIL